MQQALVFVAGQDHASYGLTEGVGDAEADAEEDGEMRTFDMDGVGVGLSLATGMAEVTEKMAVKPIKRVVGCIIALVCDVWGRE